MNTIYIKGICVCIVSIEYCKYCLLAKFSADLGRHGLFVDHDADGFI